ncbi:MAG: DUF192 domain-containing protein [Treponema sp.]|nr:DUF192 domain-containing protein [Treponema sp.]
MKYQNLCKPKTAAAKKLAAIFAAALLCAAAASCQKGNPKLKTKTLSIATASGSTVFVEAEIADKPETREKGYMFRKNIPDGTGMLFVFEEDKVLRFWMKNTPSPLSIAYIDYKGEIKDIFDMKPFDLNDTTATGYVRYALEVPQGWFGRAGIKVGDKLKLDF